MNETPNLRSRLILASASPRRRALLSVFDLDFEVQPADVDEAPRPGEAPGDYVLRVAEDKARSVAGRNPAHPVLGSDTTVAIGGEILGKPSGQADARQMLKRLSASNHEVHSAVVLVHPDGSARSRLSTTRVEMAELPAEWIENYIASGEPDDKAGAYGIQGAAGIWVRELSGSYTGVMGLPLYETGVLLREAGLA